MTVGIPLSSLMLLLLAVLTGVTTTYSETTSCKGCGFPNEPLYSASCDAPVDVNCTTDTSLYSPPQYKCVLQYDADADTGKPGKLETSSCKGNGFTNNTNCHLQFDHESVKALGYLCVCLEPLCDPSQNGLLDKAFEQGKERLKVREEEKAKEEKEEKEKKEKEEREKNKGNSAPFILMGSTSWINLLWTVLTIAVVLQ